MDKNYKQYLDYKVRIDKRISDFLAEQTGNSDNSRNNKYIPSLYEPLNYIMSGGGKRIRPLIVLLSCEAFGGSFDLSIDAAVAVEILHNFTLVHDDIMDNADTRRGRVTLHKKWSVNTAILAGDELIALSYKSLLKTKSKRIGEIVKTFTEGIIQVCEGQALDKEFEECDNIQLDDYLTMIRKKTAEMVKISAVIGAMISDAGDEEIESVGKYSENIGIAFQIQDDILDVSAKESELGKKIGGDIMEKKKTYLYLKALELADESEKSKLIKLYNSFTLNSEKVSEVLDIFKRLGVIDSARLEVQKYVGNAANNLTGIKNTNSREMFNWLSQMLLNRNY
ncbi:MAG: polyprenyl synthetase family protein [Ignavibacteria bacterium]